MPTSSRHFFNISNAIVITGFPLVTVDLPPSIASSLMCFVGNLRKLVAWHVFSRYLGNGTRSRRHATSIPQ
jgi:hypothetical protein